MTGLLVSVRDAKEAEAAIAGGADLIDIKEPNAGSLGAASVETWNSIAAAVGQRRPLSVALGELVSDPVCRSAANTGGMTFAKIGLAGCDSQPDWTDRWTHAIGCCPKDVGSVAVIYADYQTANAPAPLMIVQQAIELRCKAVLFDTHSKLRGNLFQHLAPSEIEAISTEVRCEGLKVVLAGSLVGESIHRAMQLAPDFIAVRGAACRGDRREMIERDLVAELAGIVHATPTASL